MSTSAVQTGASVDLRYGDSLTGTHASGPVVRDTVAIAGLSMEDQLFASVNDTDNSAVQNGGAGIFGLGFPSQSFIQAAVVNNQFNDPETTDAFVARTAADGPLVARLAMSGQVQFPMFSVTLQRNTIDIGGNEGRITIGDYPPEITPSDITWVPVRLYRPEDGGQNPPTFAPDEVYPLRWEVPLDGVFLDGERLPDTNLTGDGLDSNPLTALIDTGNSLMRGPSDVVTTISQIISLGNTPSLEEPTSFPCSTPHTLAFQIGGKMFPVDPRDFVTPDDDGDALNCTAGNLVETDPPSIAALFSWNLGDPFFKSNVVIFYYGNLTNPSVDPPRIGFVSTVPDNAGDLLRSAVEVAEQNGGEFPSTVDIAPPAGVVTNVAAGPLPSIPTQEVSGGNQASGSIAQTSSSSTIYDYRPHPAFCPSFMFWCLFLYFFP